MSKKTEIKKIVLDIGGVEVNLTPEQAKKLHSLLDELFGDKNTQYIPYPSPVIIERRRWWWDSPYVIWSSSGAELEYNHETSSLCCKF